MCCVHFISSLILRAHSQNSFIADSQMMTSARRVCSLLIGIMLLSLLCPVARGGRVRTKRKGLESTENNLCSCPYTQSEKKEVTFNAVILSATGRVGSSNLLSMLGSHQYIQDIGEIFIASRFRSQKLPPNINSPKNSPASSAVKQRIISHIKQSLLPKGGNKFRGKETSVSSSTSLVHRLASVKFWHAWENGVGVGWMVRHLRACG